MLAKNCVKLSDLVLIPCDAKCNRLLGVCDIRMAAAPPLHCTAHAQRCERVTRQRTNQPDVAASSRLDTEPRQPSAQEAYRRWDASFPRGSSRSRCWGHWNG